MYARYDGEREREKRREREQVVSRGTHSIFRLVTLLSVLFGGWPSRDEASEGFRCPLLRPPRHSHFRRQVEARLDEHTPTTFKEEQMLWTHALYAHKASSSPASSRSTTHNLVEAIRHKRVYDQLKQIDALASLHHRRGE